jgi:hypothetical protein
MKNSEKPASETDSNDIEFPDLSGMDDSSPRLRAEAAFRLSEQHPRLLQEASAKNGPGGFDQVLCRVRTLNRAVNP